MLCYQCANEEEEEEDAQAHSHATRRDLCVCGGLIYIQSGYLCERLSMIHFCFFGCSRSHSIGHDERSDDTFVITSKSSPAQSVPLLVLPYHHTILFSVRCICFNFFSFIHLVLCTQTKLCRRDSQQQKPRQSTRTHRPLVPIQKDVQAASIFLICPKMSRTKTDDNVVSLRIISSGTSEINQEVGQQLAGV